MADPICAVIGQIPPHLLPDYEFPHFQRPGYSTEWGNNENGLNWLFATYCQGHFSVFFDNEELADCQCVCMSLAALVYAVIFGRNLPPRRWTIADLYDIMLDGNNCYAQTLDYVAQMMQELDRLRKTEYFLAVSHIKPEVFLFGRTINVRAGELFFGYILRGKRKFGGLIHDIRDFFRRTNYGIIITDRRARGIFFIDEKFYIFDPHAVLPHGAAVVIENASIDELFDTLKDLIRGERSEEELVMSKYDLIPIEIDADEIQEQPEPHLVTEQINGNILLEEAQEEEADLEANSPVVDYENDLDGEENGFEDDADFCEPDFEEEEYEEFGYDLQMEEHSDLEPKITTNKKPQQNGFKTVTNESQNFKLCEDVSHLASNGLLANQLSRLTIEPEASAEDQLQPQPVIEYSCHCSKTFPDLDKLQHHQLVTHLHVKKPFRCSYDRCSYDSHRRDYVRDHVGRKHYNIRQAKERKRREEELIKYVQLKSKLLQKYEGKKVVVDSGVVEEPESEEPVAEQPVADVQLQTRRSRRPTTSIYSRVSPEIHMNSNVNKAETATSMRPAVEADSGDSDHEVEEFDHDDQRMEEDSEAEPIITVEESESEEPEAEQPVADVQLQTRRSRRPTTSTYSRVSAKIHMKSNVNRAETATPIRSAVEVKDDSGDSDHEEGKFDHDDQRMDEDSEAEPEASAEDQLALSPQPVIEYSCHCLKAFSDLDKLQHHQLVTHLHVKKPFRCSYGSCSYDSNRHDLIRNHVAAVHLNIRQAKGRKQKEEELKKHVRLKTELLETNEVEEEAGGAVEEPESEEPVAEQPVADVQLQTRRSRRPTTSIYSRVSAKIHMKSNVNKAETATSMRPAVEVEDDSDHEVEEFDHDDQRMEEDFDAEPKNGSKTNTIESQNFKLGDDVSQLATNGMLSRLTVEPEASAEDQLQPQPVIEYSCHCSKAFPDLGKLQHHQLVTHLHVKNPFRCIFGNCSFDARRRDYVRDHVGRKHYDIRQAKGRKQKEEELIKYVRLKTELLETNEVEEEAGGAVEEPESEEPVSRTRPGTSAETSTLTSVSTSSTLKRAIAEEPKLENLVADEPTNTAKSEQPVTDVQLQTRRSRRSTTSISTRASTIIHMESNVNKAETAPGPSQTHTATESVPEDTLIRSINRRFSRLPRTKLRMRPLVENKADSNHVDERMDEDSDAERKITATKKPQQNQSKTVTIGSQNFPFSHDDDVSQLASNKRSHLTVKPDAPEEPEASAEDQLAPTPQPAIEYSCHCSKKTYSDLDKLQYHQLVHHLHVKKPFRCGYNGCSYDALQPYRIRNHIATVHYNIRQATDRKQKEEELNKYVQLKSDLLETNEVEEEAGGAVEEPESEEPVAEQPVVDVQLQTRRSSRPPTSTYSRVLAKIHMKSNVNKAETATPAVEADSGDSDHEVEEFDHDDQRMEDDSEAEPIITVEESESEEPEAEQPVADVQLQTRRSRRPTTSTYSRVSAKIHMKSNVNKAETATPIRSAVEVEADSGDSDHEEGKFDHNDQRMDEDSEAEPEASAEDQLQPRPAVKHSCHCSKTFSSLYNLQYHQLVYHLHVKKPFRCGYNGCSYDARRPYSIRNHIAAVHYNIRQTKDRKQKEEEFKEFVQLKTELLETNEVVVSGVVEEPESEEPVAEQPVADVQLQTRRSRRPTTSTNSRVSAKIHMKSNVNKAETATPIRSAVEVEDDSGDSDHEEGKFDHDDQRMDEDSDAEPEESAEDQLALSPQPVIEYSCHCSKTFSSLYNLQHHQLVSHLHVKRPFRCGYKGCSYDSRRRDLICNHVAAVHHNIPQAKGRKQNKKQFKEYVHLKTELLETNEVEEEAGGAVEEPELEEPVAEQPVADVQLQTRRSRRPTTSTYSRVSPEIHMKSNVNKAETATLIRSVVEVEDDSEQEDVESNQQMDEDSDAEPEASAEDQLALSPQPVIEYSCHCSKTFSSLHNLQHHQLVSHLHVKRPFRCGYNGCSYDARRPYSIRNHIAAVHYNIRQTKVRKQKEEEFKEFVQLKTELLETNEVVVSGTVEEPESEEPVAEQPVADVQLQTRRSRCPTTSTYSRVSAKIHMKSNVNKAETATLIRSAVEVKDDSGDSDHEEGKFDHDDQRMDEDSEAEPEASAEDQLQPRPAIKHSCHCSKTFSDLYKLQLHQLLHHLHVKRPFRCGYKGCSYDSCRPCRVLQHIAAVHHNIRQAKDRKQKEEEFKEFVQLKTELLETNEMEEEAGGAVEEPESEEPVAEQPVADVQLQTRRSRRPTTSIYSRVSPKIHMNSNVNKAETATSMRPAVEADSGDSDHEEEEFDHDDQRMEEDSEAEPKITTIKKPQQNGSKTVTIESQNFPFSNDISQMTSNERSHLAVKPDEPEEPEASAEDQLRPQPAIKHSCHCSKAFSDLDELQHHQLVHHLHVKKPFRCCFGSCSYDALHPYRIRNHVAMVHLNIRQATDRKQKEEELNKYVRLKTELLETNEVEEEAGGAVEEPESEEPVAEQPVADVQLQTRRSRRPTTSTYSRVSPKIHMKSNVNKAETATPIRSVVEVEDDSEQEEVESNQQMDEDSDAEPEESAEDQLALSPQPVIEYSCHCSKTFSSLHNLQHHQLVSHLHVKRPFRCGYNGCSYDSRRCDLICNHVAAVHHNIRQAKDRKQNKEQFKEYVHLKTELLETNEVEEEAGGAVEEPESEEPVAEQPVADVQLQTRRSRRPTTSIYSRVSPKIHMKSNVNKAETVTSMRPAVEADSGDSDHEEVESNQQMDEDSNAEPEASAEDQLRPQPAIKHSCHCSKTFSDLYKLQLHQLLHHLHMKRPFRCGYKGCSYDSHRRDRVLQHIAAVHHNIRQAKDRKQKEEEFKEFVQLKTELLETNEVEEEAGGAVEEPESEEPVSEQPVADVQLQTRRSRRPTTSFYTRVSPKIHMKSNVNKVETAPGPSQTHSAIEEPIDVAESVSEEVAKRSRNRHYSTSPRTRSRNRLPVDKQREEVSDAEPKITPTKKPRQNRSKTVNIESQNFQLSDNVSQPASNGILANELSAEEQLQPRPAIKHSCHCSKTFTSLYKLQHHQLVTHLNVNKPFRCTFKECSYDAPRVDYVRDHVLVNHFMLTRKMIRQAEIRKPYEEQVEEYVHLMSELLENNAEPSSVDQEPELENRHSSTLPRTRTRTRPGTSAETSTLTSVSTSLTLKRAAAEEPVLENPVADEPPTHAAQSVSVKPAKRCKINHTSTLPRTRSLTRSGTSASTSTLTLKRRAADEEPKLEALVNDSVAIPRKRSRTQSTTKCKSNKTKNIPAE